MNHIAVVRAATDAKPVIRYAAKALAATSDHIPSARNPGRPISKRANAKTTRPRVARASENQGGMLRGNSVLLQKCHQLVWTKVSKDVSVPFEGGCFCLAGQLNHSVESGLVGEHVDFVVLVTVGVEVFPSGNTPRAPDFDVEIHRKRSVLDFRRNRGRAPTLFDRAGKVSGGV